ncbi:17332_t:CDS:2 [Gigaspora margarita]|uniref:17332_t:CDS:1 n=1 Tax=Gigaspora margarita TaxID=4874 RepID=A0ABN7UER0_GIGMA|nr:17332_t:CDS:2 [Gigaspora margarita]
MTVVRKETTHEVLRKDQDFSFREGFINQVPMHLIFKHVTIPEKNAKIVRDYVAEKLKHFISRLQKNILKAMDLYISECVEPKVIRDSRKTFTCIIAIPVANIIVGEACICDCYNEDLLETFRDLTFSIIKLLDALQCFLDDLEVTPDLDPNHVNYDCIADSIGALIFAAMKTTSSSFTHVLYNLVKRKHQYWQELYQEAQKINKQCNENELTTDDIVRMVKLDSFVKESLRLSNPITGLPHKCISKSYFTFANRYQVPRGRIVSLNYHDTNNDKELQGQNPIEFRAYHHLEHNSPATKLECNFLIFGGRKHACPGKALAVNEIKVFLYKVLLKYNIRTDNEEIGPKRRYLGPAPAPINVGLVFEKRKEIIN